MEEAWRCFDRFCANAARPSEPNCGYGPVLPGLGIEGHKHMSNIWFTSDQHFGHANIITYCKRPFQSVEEHDEALIERHNAVVKTGDRVFMLGDFGMGPKGRLPGILKRLSGQLFYIWGNHDRDKGFIDAVRERAVWTGDLYTLKVGKLRTVLCHYPIAEWDGFFRGSFHVHGHSHGNHPSPAPLRRLDVGVDVHAYRPTSFEEVRAYMEAPERGPGVLEGRVEL